MFLFVFRCILLLLLLLFFFRTELDMGQIDPFEISGGGLFFHEIEETFVRVKVIITCGFSLALFLIILFFLSNAMVLTSLLASIISIKKHKYNDV